MLEERIKIGEVEPLDQFHARELGCDVATLRRPGLQIVVSDRRAKTGWGGYTVPILALSTNGGGIVACRSDLEDAVRQELVETRSGEPLGEADLERLRRMVRHVIPYAYTLNGYALYCDAERFKPYGDLAEHLPPSNDRGRDLRRRFDGEIFVVWGPGDQIASWAAIKLKSRDVWEIAVVTEAAYRGRGYAKQVVSAATEYILSRGRLSLYVHDRANHASARVCRSLGYAEYAEEFFCEY